MDSQKKSTAVTQSDRSEEQKKTPALRVETGIRAGWIPGSNVREALRNWRSSTPGEQIQPAQYLSIFEAKLKSK